MISITGEYLSGDSSHAQPATLLYKGEQEFLMLVKDGEISNSVDDFSVSTRLGNIPRYMSFANGSKFVTDDNDAIDELLQKIGKKITGNMLHKLESHSLFVALSLVLLVASMIYSITVVIPRFADETAKLAPFEISTTISENALNAFDQSILQPTETPENIQNMLRSEFEFLSNPYGEEFSFKLHFRKSEIIGANAFALPTGDIVVTDALLQLAQHKDEILAILAHEVGHVVHRHGIRRLFEDSMIAVLIFTITGDMAQISQIATTMPALVISRQYSQNFEREADEFAHKVMLENNIDLMHFSNILTRINEIYEKHENVPTFFSTHPETSERVEMFKNSEDM